MSYKQKLISVIIPVYNVEKYLARCLDSIIENTYKELEIICINDGSTDSCLKILNSYKNQDSRIIIIDKANGGLSSARNSGLKIATGEYVAFIDSDDWVHPKYFEYLLKAITEFKADFSICTHIRVKDADKLPNTEYSSQLITVNDLLKKKFRLDPFVWQRLYTHTSIENLFFDENEKIEDVDFTTRLFIRKPNIKMAYINMPLYAYYAREKSLSTYLTKDTQLTFAEKQAAYIHMANTKKLKSIIANSAIKRVISARFVFLALNDKEKVERCNVVIKKSLPYSLAFRNIILGIFPSVYRFIMITLDPTMRTYEKNLKMKNKNES